MARDDRDVLRENARKFTDFLEQDFGQGSYAAKVRSLVEIGRTRLIVNLNHLRQFDPDLTRRFAALLRALTDGIALSCSDGSSADAG